MHSVTKIEQRRKREPKQSKTAVVDIDTGLVICNASHENIFLGKLKRFR